VQGLGGRDGPGMGEHKGLGQQRTQENLDESLIENWERRWLWSCHDRVAVAIPRALVITGSVPRTSRHSQEGGRRLGARGEAI
jgi:hypothetical protein